MGSNRYTSIRGLAAVPWAVALIILVAAVALLSPALFIQLPWGDDTISHLNWNRTLTGLWSTQPGYNRWLDIYNGGLESPDYFFYPPLSAYVAVIAEFLLSGLGVSLVGLKVSSVLALSLSGLFTYLWLSTLTGDRKAALAGAILYMLLPYHLAVDYYWRTALAESWAFVWFPLIMLAGWSLAKGSQFGVLALSVSYCGLILTHLPATLYFSLFLPVLVTWFAERPARLRTFIAACVSMAIGIALSAFNLYRIGDDAVRAYRLDVLGPDPRNAELAPGISSN
jgi:uncharacterized membrane protein